MSNYKTLRTWSLVLIIVGIFQCAAAVVGSVAWFFALDEFWERLGVVLVGAPFVLLLATWPIALAQAMRALADIGDSVIFDPTTALTPTTS